LREIDVEATTEELQQTCFLPATGVSCPVVVFVWLRDSLAVWIAMHAHQTQHLNAATGTTVLRGFFCCTDAKYSKGEIDGDL
jgi:hypothetical protein